MRNVILGTVAVLALGPLGCATATAGGRPMDHGVARGTVPHGPRLARNAAANATGDCLADLFGAALETALDGATAPGVPVAAPENPVAIDAQVEVARQRVAAIEAQPPAPEPTVPEAAPRPVIASSTPAGE